MSTVYFKKLSGEVIAVKTGENNDVYPYAYAHLGSDKGYEIKLFHDGELLSRDAKVAEGQVIDVLYVPLRFEADIQYIENWRSEEFGIGLDDDRYRVYVTLDGTIVHRFFFYEREGVFTPDHPTERFKMCFNSFAELVEYMIPKEYTEEIHRLIVDTVVGEWVPKHVDFEKND